MIFRKRISTEIIILLSMLLISCKKQEPSQDLPRPAYFISIGNQQMNTGMTLVGEVKPRFESPQGFRIDGKIIGRSVEIGSKVKKGQLISRLDPSNADLALASSKADISVAEAELALAKSNLDRQKQLYEQKFISAAALDAYEAQYKYASAYLQQARAQSSLSSNNSNYTSLLAERDGIITDIHAEPGQVVNAGDVITKIADPTLLEVNIPVPESRMGNIKVGDDVIIKLWASQDKNYRGKIREIAPAADPATRSFLVKASILNPDENVRIGMTAALRMKNTKDEYFLIPSESLTEMDGKPIVWLLDEMNRAYPHVVSVSTYTEYGAQIASGLKTGDKIITSGIQVLVPGEKVIPIESSKNK